MQVRQNIEQKLNPR